MEETKDSWTISTGEKSLEPKTKEHSICLSITFTSISKTTYSELHGMAKEDVHHYLNEERDQDHHDYIEHWFQKIITSRHCSLLPQPFVSHHLQQLVIHTSVYLKVYFSNLSMNVSVYLLSTWLHWKYSHT